MGNCFSNEQCNNMAAEMFCFFSCSVPKDSVPGCHGQTASQTTAGNTIIGSSYDPLVISLMWCKANGTWLHEPTTSSSIPVEHKAVTICFHLLLSCAASCASPHVGFAAFHQGSRFSARLLLASLTLSSQYHTGQHWKICTLPWFWRPHRMGVIPKVHSTM